MNRQREISPLTAQDGRTLRRPPSKAAVTFLRSTAGNANGNKLSSVVAGVARSNLLQGYSRSSPVQQTFEKAQYTPLLRNARPGNVKTALFVPSKLGSDLLVPHCPASSARSDFVGDRNGWVWAAAAHAATL